ncbi:MAG: hypothetical protein MI922_26450 [Bacteroidales bacterium]|nr:hypothetical protein [Bacteroidales bacterium]
MIKKFIFTFCYTTIILSCEKEEFQLPDSLIGSWMNNIKFEVTDVVQFDDNNTFKMYYKFLDDKKERSDSLLYISSGNWNVVGKDMIELNHNAKHFGGLHGTCSSFNVHWKIISIKDETLVFKRLPSECFYGDNTISTYKKLHLNNIIY